MSVVLFIIPHKLGGIDDGNGLCDQLYKSCEKSIFFFSSFCRFNLFWYSLNLPNPKSKKVIAFKIPIHPLYRRRQYCSEYCCFYDNPFYSSQKELSVAVYLLPCLNNASQTSKFENTISNYEDFFPKLKLASTAGRRPNFRIIVAKGFREATYRLILSGLRLTEWNTI